MCIKRSGKGAWECGILHQSYSHPTAAQELVRTTRLTDLAATHALSTAWVPSTAGWMSSLSSFGVWVGNGLATWITYFTSFTAL